MIDLQAVRDTIGGVVTDFSTSIKWQWSWQFLGTDKLPDFESAGWWQKPTRRVKCKQCAHCGDVKEFGKGFYKTQLGRGGRTEQTVRSRRRTVFSTQIDPVMQMAIRQGFKLNLNWIRTTSTITADQEIKETLGHSLTSIFPTHGMVALKAAPKLKGLVKRKWTYIALHTTHTFSHTCSYIHLITDTYINTHLHT